MDDIYILYIIIYFCLIIVFPNNIFVILAVYLNFCCFGTINDFELNGAQTITAKHF